MFDLVLKQALIEGRQNPAEICVADGRIAQIVEAGDQPAIQEIDLNGRLVLPGFVDAHMHLDKCLVAERFERQAVSLEEARVIMKQVKGAFTRQDVKVRARRAIGMAVSHGTTTIRTHIDVDSGIGLLSLEVLLELREELSSVVDLQFALTSRREIVTSNEVQRLFREAMRLGADLMGGTPEPSAEGEKHVDIVFEIASEFDRKIDLHLDETIDQEDLLIPYVTKKTVEAGYEGRVTASHLCALGSIEPDKAQEIIEEIIAAEIGVVTLPSSNLHIQGRTYTKNPPRGLTRVRELLRAGVNVGYGCDNMRDAFVPFGTADMLEAGLLLAHAAHMGDPQGLVEVVKMGTSYGARVLGITDDYGLEEGKIADLIVLDAASMAQALINQKPPLHVFKRGRLVVTNHLATKYHSEVLGM
jgi:cytosine deaminase